MAHIQHVVYSLLALFVVVSQCQNAIAVLQGTTLDSGISGTVLFEQITASKVRVSVDISGITANTNASIGMHVHQYGDITDTTGSATGGHYNPTNATHSCPSDTPRHVGDMGSWNVAGGSINQVKELELLDLVGSNSIIGRGIILHAGTDLCTGASGFAGSRLAMGVVGIKSGNATAENIPNFTKAVCVFAPTSGNDVGGTVWFDVTATTVTISAKITGLSGQAHGFHIHELGDVSGLDGTSTLSHYNPLNVIHARLPTAARHVGDLGNVQDFDDFTNITWYKQEIAVPAGLSTYAVVVGRGMIIHSGTDDGCTQSTGNAGSRLAQCVIGVQVDSAVREIPPIVISTQTQPDCTTPVTPTNTPTSGSGDVLHISFFGVLCFIAILV